MEYEKVELLLNLEEGLRQHPRLKAIYELVVLDLAEINEKAKKVVEERHKKMEEELAEKVKKEAEEKAKAKAEEEAKAKEAQSREKVDA